MKKTCNTCGEPKDRSEFRNCALAADGVAGHCKACGKKRTPKAAKAKSGEDRIDDKDGYVRRREATLGFTAQQQGEDIVIQQDTADGLKSVWLARTELVQLAAWEAQLPRAQAK